MTVLERKILITLMEHENYTVPQLSVKLNIDADDLYAPIQCLIKNNHLRFNLPEFRDGKEDKLIYNDDTFRVTYDGKRALEFDTNERKEKRRLSVRYWITTGISIIALILAIIANIRQGLLL
jgi:hypothetical protein